MDGIHSGAFEVVSTGVPTVTGAVTASFVVSSFEGLLVGADFRSTPQLQCFGVSF